LGFALRAGFGLGLGLALLALLALQLELSFFVVLKRDAGGFGGGLGGLASGFLLGGALGAHFLKFAGLALRAGLEDLGSDGRLGLDLGQQGLASLGLTFESFGE